MSYVEALKQYRDQTGKFVIPRKGTTEHEQVKRIHAELKNMVSPIIPPEPVITSVNVLEPPQTPEENAPKKRGRKPKKGPTHYTNALEETEL